MALVTERHSSNEVLGKALTELLWKRRMRAADLAKAMNVSRSHVHHWVSGHYLPKAKMLDGIAKVLKVSYATLFTLPRSE